MGVNMGLLCGLLMTINSILMPQQMMVTYYNESTCRSVPCLTASKEPFDSRLYTAAHISLPFNTRVKVTYKGKSVIVRINDRISKKYAHRLDITEAAAIELGFKHMEKHICFVEVIK